MPPADAPKIRSRFGWNGASCVEAPLVLALSCAGRVESTGVEFTVSLVDVDGSVLAVLEETAVGAIGVVVRVSVVVTLVLRRCDQD